MKTSIKIGEIKGIPVRLHITLIFAVGFIAWSIGANIFQIAELIGVESSAIQPGLESYILGTALAVGLFISVFVHEMAHSLTAMKNGIKIEEITLWIFGGVSNMEEIPKIPRLEIVISIVGPLTSFGIGIGSYVVGFLISNQFFVFLFTYLGFINLILGVFNMLPAFPLDGGRVLRAALATRSSYITATRNAANIGKVFAVGLGIFGLFFNPFLILIAFFIFIGASQESQSVMVRETLQNVKVKDIMSTDVKTIYPDMKVEEFLEYLLTHQHTGYPVMDKGKIIGIMTLGDARKVDERRRDVVTVGEIMERDVKCLGVNQDVGEVWKEMIQREVGRFPVLYNDNLVGIITRLDLMRTFNVLTEIEKFRGGEI